MAIEIEKPEKEKWTPYKLGKNPATGDVKKTTNKVSLDLKINESDQLVFATVKNFNCKTPSWKEAEVVEKFKKFINEVSPECSFINGN